MNSVSIVQFPVLNPVRFQTPSVYTPGIECWSRILN